MTAAPKATTGVLQMGGFRAPCAVGRAGVLRAKREGDGGTPAGIYPLRALWYRPDRLARPRTSLQIHVVAPSDGWCDDPNDSSYNRPVTLPYPASAEHMWREDHLYDLVIVIGYNDDPVVRAAGSAIFLHAAGEWNGQLLPTAGCVSLPLPDLLDIAAKCSPRTQIRIANEGA